MKNEKVTICCNSKLTNDNGTGEGFCKECLEHTVLVETED